MEKGNGGMTLLQDAEYRDAESLASHQQSAWELQRDHVVKNSAFYRALWKEAPPPKRLEDIPLLPLSDKAQLRERQAAHPPFGDYLAADPSAAQRLHRTSGTTGQAMNLLLSARDCRLTEAVGGRAQRAAGLKAGHRVVHCLNYQLWMGGLTDHLTLEQTGAMVIPFGVGGTEKLIRTISEVGINAISCTPSYPAVLERVIAERFPGMKPRELGIKLGLFGGEPGLDDKSFRERMRETWGMEPRNANYGVSDVFCNFAAQCEHDSRLHFLAGDVLYPELIDPVSAEPVPFKAGQEGELVLTHLERDCQPLVRFRTGDIIAVDETSSCACGRTAPRFRVVGRSDDMVVVRGLNLFPSMVAAVVSTFDELSGDYRIPLEGPPPYDALPVQVELAREGGIPDDLAAALEGAIKAQLGATAKVTVLPARSFPLTEGKTQRVIRSQQ